MYNISHGASVISYRHRSSGKNMGTPCIIYHRVPLLYHTDIETSGNNRGTPCIIYYGVALLYHTGTEAEVIKRHNMYNRS